MNASLVSKVDNSSFQTSSPKDPDKLAIGHIDHNSPKNSTIKEDLLLPVHDAKPSLGNRDLGFYSYRDNVRNIFNHTNYNDKEIYESQKSLLNGTTNIHKVKLETTASYRNVSFIDKQKVKKYSKGATFRNKNKLFNINFTENSGDCVSVNCSDSDQDAYRQLTTETKLETVDKSITATHLMNDQPVLQSSETPLESPEIVADDEMSLQNSSK